jgi:hypothetical protein
MESGTARCLRPKGGPSRAAASQTYAHSRLLQDIEPAHTGTRSLGQVVSSPGPETRRAQRKQPRLFGGGFYAEAGEEIKLPRSTFTPGPIVEDRLTF